MERLHKFVKIIESTALFAPLVSVILILAGFFNLYNYYNFFGVDITNYVEIGEIVFSFSAIFNDILLLGVAFLIVVVITAIRESRRKPSTTAPTKVERIVVAIIRLLLLLGATIVFGLAVTKDGRLSGIELIILFFFGTSFIFLLLLDTSWFGVTGIGRHIITGCFVLVIPMLFVITRNFLRYQSIVNGNPKYSVELLGEIDVKSDADNVYVGSTKNYHFFYSRSKEECTVYRSSLFDMTTVKKKHLDL
jgi:hypothetical protein